SLYMYRYWEVMETFNQAGKYEELAKVFDDVDVKQLGAYWAVSEVLQPLLESENTRAQGMRLFRKAWLAFPEERPYILGNLYSEEAWRLPEIYDYVHQAMVPGEGDFKVEAWGGLDQIINYSGDGRFTSVASRLLEAASRQNKLEALRREVVEDVRKLPDWSAGKVLLA